MINANNALLLTINEGYCSSINDYARVKKEVEPVVSNSELMVCKDLKAFTEEWNNTIKTKLDKKVEELEVGIEFHEVWRPIHDWIKPLNRDIENLESPGGSFTSPADQLQGTAERAQVPF